MSLSTVVWLNRAGIPADVVNLISQYATNGWIYEYTSKGIVRSIYTKVFENVIQLQMFRANVAKTLRPQPILYNRDYMFQHSMTIELPPQTVDYEIITHTGKVKNISTALSRRYTSVEVAKNTYEYVLQRIRTTPGIDEVYIPLTHIHRPYTTDPHGREQIVYHCETNAESNQLEIEFAEWYGGWVWLQQGVMDNAVHVPQPPPNNFDNFVDEDEVIEWADDDIEPAIFDWDIHADNGPNVVAGQQGAGAGQNIHVNMDFADLVAMTAWSHE
jgi:hypothetical protein